jgi:cyanophycin synthetase
MGVASQLELVEIRELEGPNLFLLEPAIKIEVRLSDSDFHAAETSRQIEASSESEVEIGPQVPPELSALASAARALHEASGLRVPSITVAQMEETNNYSVAFGWSNRAVAREIAAAIAELIRGPAPEIEKIAREIRSVAEKPMDEGNRPAMITDDRRRVKTIAVTGTNGKTTTTRLIAHIFLQAGRKVGWSSSSGVYINGEEVLAGDYSGPKGAERVITDPSVEIAVTEIARGGILLKGIVCESVDVSVFTNVSSDHLDLQGVHTVEGLARVKAVLPRITKEEGYAVLNASDPLVLASTQQIRAGKFLVSRDSENRAIQSHRARGGWSITLDGTNFLISREMESIVVVPIAEVPMTFDGRAGFMVDNAMCGMAAAIAAGASLDEVRLGLLTFENSPEQNPGRLNIFQIDDVTVILDFAHNEAGLEALLEFASQSRTASSRLIAIIGTAGDRNERSLRELGKIAAEQADFTIAKGTKKYLRGRELENLLELYVAGIESVPGAQYSVSTNEVTAVQDALKLAHPGDVIAIMAQEHIPELHEYLSERARLAS